MTISELRAKLEELERDGRGTEKALCWMGHWCDDQTFEEVDRITVSADHVILES